MAIWPTTVLGILVVAGVITVFEHYCKKGVVAQTFTRWFRASKKATERQIPRDVAQGIVKLIGTVHCAIQIPMAWTVMTDTSMQSDPLYSTSPRSQAMLIISAGYFLHDVVTCLRNYSDWGLEYLLHASSCWVLYTYGALSGYLHYFGAVFLLWECSTPFVYVRWFLWKMGKNRGKLYLYNGLIMVVVFFLCRNVLGTVNSIEYWRTTAQELSQPRPGGIPVGVMWFYRVLNVALNALNLFWFYKMASGAVRVVTGGNPDSTHQE